jgi:hypothetical protein
MKRSGFIRIKVFGEEFGSLKIVLAVRVFSASSEWVEMA